MKLIVHKGILITLATTLAFSCASTPKVTDDNPQTTIQEEPKTEEVVNLPTAAELYSQKLEGLSLSLLSFPKQTTKGKIFTEPYTIEVKDSEGNPVESFEISVIYPASRKNGQIEFTETAITTDSEGKASFLPDIPAFSFNSEVSFFPKGDMTDAEIANIAEAHTIKAPYKVQTNLKSAGGTIAIVDFNQNGKAITSNPISSSNILMTLMKLGFTRIGNAPQDVSDAVIQGDEQKVFARANPIAPSFIIFGTVKIDSNEKTDEGTTYTLTGSVKAMDSKTGEISFAIEKTISVTDKNDWNALANARKQLAEQLSNEIKYGI